MTTTQPRPVLSDGDLATWVRDSFGLRLAALSRVASGEDVDAFVIRVRVDGRDESSETSRANRAGQITEVAVKVTRRSTTAGLLTARRLADAGVRGVPAPLLSRSGLPWSRLDGWQVSLVPWVEGHVAADVGMSASQWRAYGALLAAVHSARLPPGVADTLPREDHRTPAVSTAKAVGARVTVSSQEAGKATSAGDEVASATHALWSQVATTIREVVRMTEALGERLRVLPRHDVLCHGDAHTVNVVLGGDGLPWLLDWDEVVLAPRERDLMFVLGGVIASAPISAAEQEWFFDGYTRTTGYGPADVDPVRLAYYRCSWAVQDVADFADRALDLGRPVDERAHALALLRSVLSPTGIVQQAVASLHQLAHGAHTAEC